MERLRRILTTRLDVPLAPVLLPALFLGTAAGAVLVGTLLLVLAVLHSWWLGLVAFVVVPVAALGVVVVTRIACELALAISVLAGRSDEMASGLTRVETVVGGIAGDMPQLGFLRLRAVSREGAADGTDG